MTLVTNEKRIELLRQTSVKNQELYSSIETARLIKMIRKNYVITDEIFVDVVGDIILGFYPKSNFKKLLISEVGLSDETAQKIELDFKDFLAKIDDQPSVPDANKELKDRLELRPEHVAPSTQKPLTREDVLGALSPKRTMAGDIATIQEKQKE